MGWGAVEATGLPPPPPAANLTTAESINWPGLPYMRNAKKEFDNALDRVGGGAVMLYWACLFYCFQPGCF